MIELVCVRCGREMREHAGNFDLELAFYVCPDGGLSDEGAILVERGYLDGVPQSERHARRQELTRGRRAQGGEHCGVVPRPGRSLPQRGTSSSS